MIWTLDDFGNVIVAQTADGLREVSALDGQTVNAGQALAVAMSGYTIGEDTLVSGVKALSAGQYLAVPIKGGAPYQDYYRRYAPWAETLSDWSKSRDALRDLTRDILRDLVVASKGRPIAIPLSAGFDSRLIASGLKHLGHDDVLCFSYGLAGNREATAAREIAEVLGYRWTFFEYTNALARAWSTESDYDAFRRYSDSLTGIHFAQDFPAIRGLRDIGYLP
ncbi:MAG: asparagine synthase-related protein, partial [Alphaproteobacteria bacterium]|nr:asparagine synthase-related protein [Alphaproteobacteria bacterium]